jgi:inositol phosphorylceramide synthase catalytic subunit
MQGLSRHIRALWGAWWAVPLIPAFHAAAMAAMGALTPVHVAVALAVAGAAYATRWSRDMVFALTPAIMVGLAYEWLRFLVPIFVRPERVWACEIRALDLALFPAGAGRTIPDFFETHHAPVFDLYFALPYAGFLYVAALYAVYLYVRDRPRMVHFLWAFGICHLLAFTIWMIMPVAPPWYVRAYGCGIDMTALSSPARLGRVDDLLGIRYFHAFYSRSANVFGAIPSLHCALPMLGLFSAWSKIGWRTRPLHILYAASMIVASLYLDHHWVVDGLAGITLAAVAVWLAGRLLKRESRTADGPAS